MVVAGPSAAPADGSIRPTPVAPPPLAPARWPRPDHMREELLQRRLIPQLAQLAELVGEELAGNRQQTCSSPTESTGGASPSTSRRICLLLHTPGERGGSSIPTVAGEVRARPGRAPMRRRCRHQPFPSLSQAAIVGHRAEGAWAGRSRAGAGRCSTGQGSAIPNGRKRPVLPIARMGSEGGDADGMQKGDGWRQMA
ncbi:unnamed protein product [Urochloa humidicola]